MTLLLAWAGINVIAFLAFGWDKRQSIHHGSRIAERTLIALALLGGALGALTGQQVFRHKTQKQPFRLLLWCAAVINILAAIVLIRFDWIAA
ncbi:DUF1294 domain-containing protein [Terricaulis silvestris]|uniref:DUF1294 domain-containing protein n=1 Tax=Terricaulis silvestris TaxID=2686094 RepID=A0A6I6MH60_9CAUL|nr:DUF1294 domain-containing protein [Terricaulis silvestris]QGZ94140.1 hypothetical protein DSM104635_00956 [Terricaulis silvestris]